jgi:hypothetical protein
VNAQHAQPVPAPRGALVARLVGKYAYRGLILFVLAANILLAAYVVAVILPSVVRIELGPSGWVAPVVTPSPTPTPTPTPGLMAPVGVLMPEDADCSACHSAPGVTKPAPVMAHPLEGWRDCTECHATNKLVATAPGHTSLHKEDCLFCHKPAADQSPAPKPHHTYNGTACTVCHGNAAIPQAPLPTDMAGRTNCWVCHGLTQGDELWTATSAPKPSATVGPRGTLPPVEP